VLQIYKINKQKFLFLNYIFINILITLIVLKLSNL